MRARSWGRRMIHRIDPIDRAELPDILASLIDAAGGQLWARHRVVARGAAPDLPTLTRRHPASASTQADPIRKPFRQSLLPSDGSEVAATPRPDRDQAPRTR